MTLAIDVHGLNKYFGSRHVVKDVSLQVEEGTITGFLGPNGSGKTTTLRLLCGLLTANSGEGTVMGLDFTTQRGLIKRKTGYMTQKFSLYDDLTIKENLTFIGRMYELPHYQDKVEAVLKSLNLFERRNQLTSALSGGWKQRLALAATTLHEPQLLLLDEPTAGVDPQARREFWDTIHSLAAKGLTVLVSTHYMDEAERCHTIGYILNGALIARGTSAEIIRDTGLVTFEITGSHAERYKAILEQQDGIISASVFGNKLHISGTSRQRMEAVMRTLPTNTCSWNEVESSLEDVFIHLMKQQHTQQGDA